MVSKRPDPKFRTGDRVVILAGPDTGRIGIIHAQFAQRLRRNGPLEYIYDVRPADCPPPIAWAMPESGLAPN